MGTSFSSDQTTLNLAVIATDTERTGRARVTSIQANGIASSTLILYDSTDTGALGTAVATYKFGTEGMQLFIPGSGILFKNGISYNLAGVSGSATLTITGA